MRKERLKRIANVTTSVTTGTLIACIIWYGVTQFTLGESIRDAKIPYLTLPQILLLGILCGVESELIMPNDDHPAYFRCSRTRCHAHAGSPIFP